MPEFNYLPSLYDNSEFLLERLTAEPINANEIRGNIERVKETQELPLAVLIGTITIGILFIVLGIIGAINQIVALITAITSLSLIEIVKSFILLLVSLFSIWFGGSFVDLSLIYKRFNSDKNAVDKLYMNAIRNGKTLNAHVSDIKQKEVWVIEYYFYTENIEARHQDKYHTELQPGLTFGETISIIYDQETHISFII